MIKRTDKVKGALYGVAIGDALGGPLEFMTAAEIKKKHGTVTEMIGGGWLDLKPGETTDDTAMTIAVAEGILKSPVFPVINVGHYFLDWYRTGPKDVGNTCKVALEHAIALGADKNINAWLEAPRITDEVLQGQTAGNGALMRTIYPALFYNDIHEMIVHARDIAKMTHAADISTRICQEYCEVIYAAIRGGDPKEHIYVRNYKPRALPTGYVLDSYSVAINSFCGTESFEEALVEAVNQGGDADTIGAITGGLAGAVYGYSQIPERWIAALDEELKAKLDHLVDEAVK